MQKKTACKWVGISAFVIVLVVLVVLAVYFYGFNSSSSVPVDTGPKLVIDHDGGADDAMAIFLAIQYEKYFNGPTIVGLTTCNGNVGEHQVFENSQRILDVAHRRDIPIYRGSGQSIVLTHPADFYFGYDGLGDLENVKYIRTEAQPEHAVNALIDMSKKYEGELILLAIGPVTNIAMAMRMDPQFINRLAHLYIAAGNVYTPEFPKPEYNALIDVEAYHIVAENARPDKLTFIPFSLIQTKHNISMDWRQNVLGTIDTPIMQAQKQFERIANKDTLTWCHLDPIAMAMVLNDLVAETKCSNNTIILCGERRGINVNDFTDCVDSTANIAFPAPDSSFKTFLYDVFTAELK